MAAEKGSPRLLRKYQGLIEKSLERILPRQYDKKALEQVLGKLSYELDVEAINKTVNVPVWDFLDRGGKRWRPVLFLALIELLGENPQEFVDLAVIFEIIHNATLIVDDIEDSSLFRRGKPTLHLIFGEDVAINAGNLLYFLPLQILDQYRTKLDQGTLLKIYQTYLDEMVKLSFGQATDIAWHKGLVDVSSVTQSQYLQMCAFKTGGLARMACRIAGLVGGAEKSVIDGFGNLGESLGVVFQIQDDILNITKSRLSLGKGLGDDITEGKVSLPVILALKNLSKTLGQRLIQILLLHTTDKKLIGEAIGLIKRGRGIKEAQKVRNKLFSQTWQELEGLLPKGEKKDQLKKLAHFLIDRTI